MKNENEFNLLQRCRWYLRLFIVLLVLSGLTAFPIETELRFITENDGWLPIFLQDFLGTVYNAVKNTNGRYPFLAYGTDWLAFAHLAIAVAFIGPLKDPIRNIWVIRFGMVACWMVIPFAFIAGTFRGIPFYWQLMDSSFGIFGLIPLIVCYNAAKKLEEIQHRQIQGIIF